MNYWTELSIEYANHNSYFDDLLRVYPAIPDGIRDIDQKTWNTMEQAFTQRNNTLLIRELLKLDLFPIKDNYTELIRQDHSLIYKNPKTVNRICDWMYEMGFEEFFRKCHEVKETNRQTEPFFRRWLNNKSLGIQPVDLYGFISSNDDAILDGNDQQLAVFSRELLNYKRDNGLDLVARFNKQYIIGKSKFITNFGEHQNEQFADAIHTLETPYVKAIKIAILDGVLYLNGNNKLYRDITTKYKKYNSMSALVLREFLYQL